MELPELHDQSLTDRQPIQTHARGQHRDDLGDVGSLDAQPRENPGNRIALLQFDRRFDMGWCEIRRRWIRQLGTGKDRRDVGHRHFRRSHQRHRRSRFRVEVEFAGHTLRGLLRGQRQQADHSQHHQTAEARSDDLPGASRRDCGVNLFRRALCHESLWIWHSWEVLGDRGWGVAGRWSLRRRARRIGPKLGSNVVPRRRDAVACDT